MKTFIFALATIFFCLSSQPIVAHAESENNNTYYAKVLSTAYFYSSPSALDEAQIFMLPESYFVLLIGEENGFYYAKYLDLYGYVKKNDVTPMDGTPTTPYATLSFRVFNENGLKIQSRPNYSSQNVGKLDYLQKDVLLYGSLNGQEPFPQSSNEWYYCKGDINGKHVNGYVFSYYCDTVTKLEENIEYFPQIEGDLVFNKGSLPSGGGLSDTVKAIIILSVALPCLVVLYLLLSPGKHKLHRKSAKKGAVVRRGKDYYELNEDDL